MDPRPSGLPAALPPPSGCAGRSRPTSSAAGGSTSPHKFLPDGLTLAGALPFLAPEEKRYFSQVQGRTYANMFGLVERFINAKVLELSRDHWFGDQTALEALIRFSDEELKHQALFRRVEALISEAMPAGYSFSLEPQRCRRGSSWAKAAGPCWR